MSLYDHFPMKKHLAYFNNAASGAMSSDCLESIKGTLDKIAQSGIDLELYEEQKKIAHEARVLLGRLLDARPEGFHFTESTTQSINLLANSLSFNKGDTIVTRGGISEHPANYVPWLYYAKKNGAEVIDTPVDRYGIPDLAAFDTMLSKIKNPRLVVLGSVIYNVGTILPVKELSKIAHGYGTLVFLDVAQSVGSLPISLSDIGCDFAAGTAAKWLCGPFGLGLFYHRKESLEYLENTDYFKGIPRFEVADGYDSIEFPLFYFRNYAYVSGLVAALNLILEFGIHEIRSKNQKLVQTLMADLARPPSTKGTVLGDFDEKIRASIVCIAPKTKDAGVLVKELRKRGIVVAKREFEGQEVIRVSPHFFNDEGEIDLLAKELAAMS